MSSQEALEAIQFLQQKARTQEESSTSASQRSASPLSLRLSPIASRSTVSTPSSSFDNDDPHDNILNHGRDASPIRTAFAQLLELSFEPKSSHQEDHEEMADAQRHERQPITMPQSVEDPLQHNIHTLPPPPPPPPPPPLPAFRSEDVSSTTRTEHIATRKTHPSTINPLASVDTSIVDESDDIEDETDDEDTFSEPFVSSFQKRNRENSLETYEWNETSHDNSLDRSDRNYNINPNMNSILKSDVNFLKEHLATKKIEEPDARNISATDLLNEHLDGLLASDKGDDEEDRRDDKVKGVAGRVNQTIHKIKELATPYFPTKLPTAACLSRDKEEIKPTYAKRPYWKSPSNDDTAITVIDTNHISSATRDPPTKLLSVEQQRVPMMRMRHPAAQDFVTEHEASSPHDEEEFVQRTSQQSREKDTEKQSFQRQRRVKESLNGPDDILKCNYFVWKGFENFVVSRCGDASDVAVEKAANRRKESSERQYSPPCSVASEKSEGSASMMRRLSKRYLENDATVVSSLDSASNRSGHKRRPTQDAPIAVLSPVPRHVAGASVRFPAQPAPMAAEQSFTESFVRKLRVEGLDILIHRKAHTDDAMAEPLRARAYLENGKKGKGGDFWGPWLVWLIGDSSVRKGIDLFDIHSLDKASALQLDQYPLAIPGRSLLLLMNEGPDHVFEVQDEASAIYFVHGIRWLIAHLSFNLIAGNVQVSCDMLEVNDYQNPWQESHQTSLMNDLTNFLVDKSATAVWTESAQSINK
ncbi:hypothetical protein FisN_32Hh055 [Fistulifera solaris]|uniref:Uncharacterized protein n=1 Tax=Fistulifera solaris TaxID=1519565 RepID=A0A1Z5K3A2_FISSO|nr:hypothetical protein FisN_32Hh055 [Fistulifera solaris]|eukprot:GAX20666.1 hypothetical protein FisN_32Hh055 [Fistulifera solaris]